MARKPSKIFSIPNDANLMLSLSSTHAEILIRWCQEHGKTYDLAAHGNISTDTVKLRIYDDGDRRILEHLMEAARGDHGTHEVHSTHRELSNRPPRNAERLLCFILPYNEIENVSGDLDERFRTVMLPKLGPRWARAWYWRQVVFSIAPLAWAFVWNHFLQFVKAARGG